MGAKPSIPVDPNRTLKVIGAGYSRTGTLSMAFALERLLNGPVMHGGCQLLGREDAYLKLWHDVMQSQHDRPKLLKHLREATRGFVGITDAPGNIFVEELLELYPDAIVVTVDRNSAEWFKSWSMVSGMALEGFVKYFLAPVPGKRWFTGILNAYLAQLDERFGPSGEDLLQKHNDWVKSVAPPDQFVMMRLSEGWGPLCEKLKLPVPSEPFPRANDAEAAKGVQVKILREAGIVWTGIILVTGIVGCGSWWLVRGI